MILTGYNKLLRVECVRAHRLVEAEAGGGVGEHVGGDGSAAPASWRWGLLGGEALEDAAEPREHGEAAVLELLILSSSRSLTRGRGGQRPSDTSPTVSSSKTGREAGG